MIHYCLQILFQTLHMSVSTRIFEVYPLEIRTFDSSDICAKCVVEVLPHAIQLNDEWP